MIKPNKVGMLIIGFFILITGCENDPLELTPLEGKSLVRTVFTLSEDSRSVQDSVLIGSSKTLYSGYLEDDILSTILLLLNYDNLQEHPICLYGDDSLNNIENIQFEFRSLQTLMDADSNLFVDTTALTIGLSSANSWSEESDLVEPEFIDFNWDIQTILESVTITDNSLQITIVDSLQFLELCNSQNKYLIIKYEPELSTLPENKLKLLEFYSSEFAISHRPQLSFDYSLLQATNKSSNKFLIDGIEISSDLFESSVHVVSDSTSQSWSRIYLLNVEPTDNFSPLEDVLLNESIVTYELDFNDEPVITSEMLEVEIEILTLTIQLNEEIIDSIDTFGLSILDNSIIFLSNSSDLSSDNYDENTNPEGTENNMVFDEGEIFNDYGIDNCPDIWETGNQEAPCDTTSVESTYNPDGTEGNEHLDWEDSTEGEENFNGIWDDGEGEKWEDVGSDGCFDKYETGNLEEPCFNTINHNYIVGTDPNGDNYNIDPTQDDYDEIEKPSGTENNGVWDFEIFIDCGFDGLCPGDATYTYPDEGEASGTWEFEDLNGNGWLDFDDLNNNNEWDPEEGERFEEWIDADNDGVWDKEHFFDIGCDGIPQIVDGDGTQGNEIHDDCEPFNDTGIDGLYSSQEEGYNNYGTEGNVAYDSGESNDAGVDGCLNQFEDGFDDCLPEINPNYVEGSDPNGDDYITDQNGDNYDENTNPEGTENNMVFDEGEYYYDFGSDGVIDSVEVFSESNFLNIGTGTSEGLNDYPISKFSTDFIDYAMPNISTDDAVLWISNIKPVPENQQTTGNKFELTFSIYATQEIKSLSFSLTHTKLDWVDTTFVSQSYPSNDYQAKFVDDISVYKINNLEDETQLILNYGHGITTNIDFVNIDSSRTPIEISLSNFINENMNILLSNEYTQLILPIDTDNSSIDEYGANLVLSGIINEEIQSLISINISQSDERIIIPMRTLLQKYINGQYINYDGFELSLDGSKYNFSNIILLNNAYLEIVHSQ